MPEAPRCLRASAVDARSRERVPLGLGASAPTGENLTLMVAEILAEPGLSAAEIAVLGSEGMPEASDGIFYRVYTITAAILAGYRRWSAITVSEFFTPSAGLQPLSINQTSLTPLIVKLTLFMSPCRNFLQFRQILSRRRCPSSGILHLSR
jgi:hypothetical protein